MEATQQLLSDEIKFLGEQLGTVIRHIEGDGALDRVERIRHLARDFRQGNEEARLELADTIESMSPSRMRVVIRAFTVFLNLANLAEDRHRLRVLRHREEENTDGPRTQSIQHAIAILREKGTAPEKLRQLAQDIDVELVFTAHPTEAKRRSVRSKLRQLRKHLQELDGSLLPHERDLLEQRIRNEMIKLWQTDLVRPKRPTVMQEVERGLSIKRALWDTLPTIFNAFRESIGPTDESQNENNVESSGEDSTVPIGNVLHYGSWIGGDRDGHPYVTVEMTEQTMSWLRFAAIDFHHKQCERLRGSLSFSSQYSAGAQDLELEVTKRLEQWPSLAGMLEDTPESEPYRRWLILIGWRLDKTRLAIDADYPPDGRYDSPQELADDVRKVRECLDDTTNELAIRFEVQPWLDRIQVFGFHLARLDVRQDAKVHREAADELLIAAKLCEDPQSLDESARCKIIEDNFYGPLLVDEDSLSDETRRTIKLFRWLALEVEQHGYEAFGGYVISMTQSPSDVLHVLWIWEFARENDASCLPVVPLFETIADLNIAEETLCGMLDLPIYHAHLEHWGNRQTVMLGYSDGTKDGGYLAACWALHDAQKRLTEVSRAREVTLTFFHGRGGSLGRGGGPAARSILALPEDSFAGRLRLTEQGEVLAERYDDPKIAHRHLEQILWASILASTDERPTVDPLWTEIMQWLGDKSRTVYRQLIDHPNFVTFFRKTTPLDAIENLPLGSRPSRRATSSGLDGLRAIPYVFSWTQCRWLVPAWFGFGSATADLKKEKPEWYPELSKMYEDWPFFRAIIDNAALAMAKADVSIGQFYGQLASDDPETSQLGQTISEEYDLSRSHVLAITETEQLLQRIPWLQESIRVRNYYVDPINMIQVELLKRIQAGEPLGDAEDIDSLLHLTRLTINGIASGMRTTG